MRYRMFLFCLSLVVMVSLIFAGDAVLASSPKPIKLKLIGNLPKSSASNNVLWWVIDDVKKRSKGALIIEYIGGPEVIGPFDQAKAIQRGVADMGYMYAGSYTNQVRAGDFLTISQLSAAEERKVGFIKIFKSHHEKVGMVYLGRGENNKQDYTIFAFQSNKMLKKPEDFAGLKIGAVSPTTNELIKELGASVVLLKFPDVYTAVSTGVVDAFWLPITTSWGIGLPKVTKYYLDHTFYRSNMVFLANPKSWNRIPKHLQDMVEDSIIEWENKLPSVYGGWIERDLKKAVGAGMKIIKFSPEDAKRFTTQAYGAAWRRMNSKIPDLVKKFRPILTK